MQTTETDRVKARPPQRVPSLLVLYSAGQIFAAPQRLVLQDGELAIGREVSDSTGLRLVEDRRLSRNHAVLTVSGAGQRVSLSDRSSKNHTYCNGLPCTQRILADGDVIRAGSTLLLFRHELAPLHDGDDTFLLGCSRAIRELRHRLTIAAKQTAPVLLCGESGTGKELAARTLHRQSGRGGPLVAINCAAIPGELAESQLFGHVRGAFSGAHSSHVGFFQQAHGGTLFLDEIGELSLALQAKLLRVVEDKSVLPVGAGRPLSCDVRLSAATHRDLRGDVQAGRFRADLYSRLAGCTLSLPPLAERREDILLLLLRAGPPNAPPLTPRLAEALLLYRFPLNVRELLQLAHELCNRASAEGETELDLPLIADRLDFTQLTKAAPSSGAMPPPSDTARSPDDRAKNTSDRGRPAPAQGEPVASPAEATASAVSDTAAVAESSPVPSSAQLSKEILQRLLTEQQGVVAEVARLLGLSRRTVGRLMLRHRLRRKDFLP